MSLNKKEKTSKIDNSRRYFIKFVGVLMSLTFPICSAKAFDSSIRNNSKDDNLKIFDLDEVLYRSLSENFFIPKQVCPTRRTSKRIC